MLTRIISGGQTGVDQAALRAAISLGFAIGGWCPPGRVCEDGAIPTSFPLQETPDDRSADAPDIPRSQRTEWNVRDSDGTLLLCLGPIADADPGTRFTADYAARSKKPIFVADPADLEDVRRVRDWISAHGIQTLNVAGPSEQSCSGIGDLAKTFLRAVLSP
ncbi:MAG: putative molybdenum carrier protein [Candidatus Korobacteraceae bacterium]